MKTTFCVVDNGGFLEVAVRLAQLTGKEVLYWTPWQRAFPITRDRAPGQGIPGVRRIQHLWEHKREIDVFCFPDVYLSDLQAELIDEGRLVWGSRNGEDLETDRLGTRRLQKALGLPTQNTVAIKGLTNLRLYLAEHPNAWIKGGITRGDFETVKAPSLPLVESFLCQRAVELGPFAEQFMFAVEEDLEDVEFETGYDGFCIDGRFPDQSLAGIERKDEVYVLCVMPYSKLPEPILRVNEALSETLATYQYRNAFSTEVMVTKRKEPFLIDPCCRFGWPPTAAMLLMLANLHEVVEAGASGQLIQPKWLAQYGCQINLTAPDGGEAWLALDFPAKYRDQVKLRNACFLDGYYYNVLLVPKDRILGAAAGMGATPLEAYRRAAEVAREVKALRIEAKTAAVASVFNEIKHAERMGYAFGTKRVPEPEVVLEDE